MARQTVHIFHFNDIHRHLDPFEDGSGGAARLDTLLAKLKTSYPDSVTVFGGDIAGDNAKPGPEAFDPMAEVLNQMDVDIFGLGNHEFEDPRNDYQTLREGLIDPYQGDVLCANVRLEKDGELLPGTHSHVIKKIGQAQVAFIGVVTRQLATAFFPNAGAGLVVAPIEQTLRELVPKVRSEGADAVVVLAHEGKSNMRPIIENLDGIDVVLSAGSNKETSRPEMVRTPSGGLTALSETLGYSKDVGLIRMTIDNQEVSVNGCLIPVSACLEPDPEVKAIVEAYEGPDRIQGPPPRRQWISIGGLQDLARYFGRRKEEKA